MTPTSRAAHQFERFAHQDQVGVVGDVAARGAQVDDRAGVGANVAVGVDVGHHVVPQFSLVLGRLGEIDIVDMRAQLVDLLFGDRQAQFRFGLGQRYPQAAPGAEFSLSSPQRGHFARSVAADERIVVKAGIRHIE